MRLAFTLLALALATPTHAAPVQASPADEVAKLSWLAGAWIAQKGATTTRETWLAPLDGAMAGAGQSNMSGRKPRIEHMKITAEAEGVTFTAIISGQSPTPFVMISGPDGEAVFENKAHDFPQRVIYRRCGEQLCARIEGTVRGQPAAQDWVYQRLR